jgi:pSer/pThr/pTyr-binding forkhead associated (FHA) protein
MDNLLFGDAAVKNCNGPTPTVARSLRLILQPSGSTMTLNRSGAILGRHSNADLRLSLPDISRRHCQFVYVDNAWHVIDLNSLNGVAVNGERVTDVVLHDRDVLGIAGLSFTVQVHESAADDDLKTGIHSHPDPEPIPRRKAS